MTALRWEPAPGGARNGEFVDVPGIGRYLIRREPGRGRNRKFRVTLNGKPVYVEQGELEFIEEQVQRAVNAAKRGELNRAAVSTTASPLPKASDLTESIRVLLMGGAPPWVQNVERRSDEVLCVLAEGRVFEVTVR